MEEYADEVFDLLDNGAHIYFCGLKGMMPGAGTICVFFMFAQRTRVIPLCGLAPNNMAACTIFV